MKSDGIKITEVPYNKFTMTPNRWKKDFNSIDIIPSSGKYSKGTFAHPDISFEFASYITPTLSDSQKRFVYAEEADVINVALFGMTAKEWRDNNPTLANNGNIRDYTDLLHLVILSNLENINAELIGLGIPQTDRLIKLNNCARRQMKLLNKNDSLIKLD